MSHGNGGRENIMRTRALLPLLIVFLLSALLDPGLLQGEKDTPTLVRAFVCEDVKDGRPLHQAIVFPVGIGKVFCYTDFEAVPQRTIVYHNWYRKDELNTRIRLVLQPPRWATYSTIHLREIDKGPWRIEITDQEEQVLRILRFSITD